MIEMAMAGQVQKFDELCECAQQIVLCVNNEEAVAKISKDLETFQERWKKLVEGMESQSKVVSKTTCQSFFVFNFLLNLKELFWFSGPLRFPSC